MSHRCRGCGRRMNTYPSRRPSIGGYRTPARVWSFRTTTILPRCDLSCACSSSTIRCSSARWSAMRSRRNRASRSSVQRPTAESHSTRSTQLKPDAITLDLEMPEIDGLGVLRQLRQRPNPPGVIVVSALTDAGAALTDPGVAARCIRLRAQAQRGEFRRKSRSPGRRLAAQNSLARRTAAARARSCTLRRQV